MHSFPVWEAVAPYLTLHLPCATKVALVTISSSDIYASGSTSLPMIRLEVFKGRLSMTLYGIATFLKHRQWASLLYQVLYSIR